TDDEELAALMRSFVNCGRGMDDPWYGHYRLGSNYRMTEFQAALLLVQLGRLEEHAERRAENAQYLNGELSRIPGVHIVREDERVTRRAYHAYLLRHVAAECDSPSREELMEALSAEGIPCWGSYSEPLYRNPLFQRSGDGPEYCPLSCPYYGGRMDYSKVECPNAERLCREAIWMSHSMLLGTREDMEDIVGAFRKVCAQE
ncbi:MAG: DegT/DnrJ/EryC1/StrS family aminotransferase, partial [Candidatus Brocadiae bacterium]|nr:DegT/DnrJ/EryC1/StrS family aminotransferase [Candidatus Brocadiia bacterium]